MWLYVGTAWFGVNKGGEIMTQSIWVIRARDTIHLITRHCTIKMILKLLCKVKKLHNVAFSNNLPIACWFAPPPPPPTHTHFSQTGCGNLNDHHMLGSSCNRLHIQRLRLYCVSRSTFFKKLWVVCRVDFRMCLLSLKLSQILFYLCALE